MDTIVLHNDSNVTITNKIVRIDHASYSVRNVSSVQRWGRMKSRRPLLLAVACAVLALLLLIAGSGNVAMFFVAVGFVAGLVYYFSRHTFFVKVTGGGGDHSVLCTQDSEYAHKVAECILAAMQAQ